MIRHENRSEYFPVFEFRRGDFECVERVMIGEHRFSITDADCDEIDDRLFVR